MILAHAVKLVAVGAAVSAVASPQPSYRATKLCFQRTDGVVVPDPHGGQRAFAAIYGSPSGKVGVIVGVAFGSSATDAREKVARMRFPKGGRLLWSGAARNAFYVGIALIEPGGRQAELPRVERHAHDVLTRCLRLR